MSLETMRDELQVVTTPAKARGVSRHGLVLMLLFAFIMGLYAWTLDFPFAFDDVIYLVNNPFMKDAGSFGYYADFHNFANKATAMGIDIDYSINFILRPVAYATFHLNYMLGGLVPYWYRLVNIIIHFANAVTLYSLLLLVLERMPKGRAVLPSSVKFIATTTAFLFAVHPLATESVTYIVQRFTSLVVCIYLLTLWLHFYASGIENAAKRRWLRALSVCIAILGMLTKESCFTAPVIAVLLDVVLLGAGIGAALKRASGLLLTMVIIPGLIIATSLAQQQDQQPVWSAIHIVNFGDNKLPVLHYFLTQITVIVEYLRLLVWPTGMNVDPDWTIHETLFALPVLASLTVIVVLLVAAVTLIRRPLMGVHSVITGVFLLYFFITLAPSSSIVPLPDMLAEHRAYLPSIGIFVVLACLLDWCRVTFSSWAWTEGMAQGMRVLGVLAFSVVTVHRNEVWRTSISLWEDTVAKSPEKARVWSNLGFAYGTTGGMARALPCFQKAVDLQPTFLNAWKNLLTAQLDQHQYKEVMATCEKLPKYIPNAASSLEVIYSQGVALCGLGRIPDGLKLLHLIAEQVPNHRPTNEVLGRYYLQTSQYPKAEKYFERVLQTDSNHREARQVLERIRSLASNDRAP